MKHIMQMYGMLTDWVKKKTKKWMKNEKNKKKIVWNFFFLW